MRYMDMLHGAGGARQEAQREALHKWKRRNLLLIGTVAALLVLLALFLPQEGLELELSGDELVLAHTVSTALSAQRDEEMRLPLAQVSSLELGTAADYGIMKSGVETKKYSAGTWESGAFGGSYHLCVHKGTAECIIATAEENGVYVFNLRGRASTEALYDAIRGLLRDMEA